MSNARKSFTKNISKWLALIIPAIVALLTGATIAIRINDGLPQITIQYADQSVPTVIELENGQTQEIDAPTVESIDSKNVAPKDECPEDSEECARGSYVPAIDITSVSSFYNSVINQCVDFDGAYGSQCYDLMAYFHYVYTGRWLSTAGTGAAYGIWDARDYNNQGGEYELIYNAADVKPGDWVIFHNGVYGHVGMAIGYYNNGYVALLGTNQGGYACPGGGASANVINASLGAFSGAFRPKIYIQPEPQPVPTPEPTTGVDYTYVKGDTFGQVLINTGLSDGSDLWGADGKVAKYNKQLEEQNYVVFYNDQYWGNIPVGSTIHLENR